MKHWLHQSIDSKDVAVRSEDFWGLAKERTQVGL